VSHDDIQDGEKHVPMNAHVRDSNSPVWDMSQERVFIENLLNQQFSFFLVVFSIVLAGALNSKVPLHLKFVLTLGSVVIVLLSTVLRRTEEKLDLILEDLFSDPTHPATIINRRAKQGASRRRLIGLWVPRLCAGVLIIAAVLAWLGIISVPGAAPGS
jgi:hypothetical protein